MNKLEDILIELEDAVGYEPDNLDHLKAHQKALREIEDFIMIRFVIGRKVVETEQRIK